MAPSARREHVIDAALAVIVEQGYEGVSIEAIARTGGVTRSSTTTSPTSRRFCRR
jgi:AcrR family transcriptional regulator